MDDGFRQGKGIGLCTESFSLTEVNLLSDVLQSKFDLVTTINPRKKSGGGIGYRLFISGKADTFNKLRSLVRPYFIPSMIYKLEGGIPPKDLDYFVRLRSGGLMFF